VQIANFEEFQISIFFRLLEYDLDPARTKHSARTRILLEQRYALTQSEDQHMITKERLEETIRGVIREFKQSKRIPDTAAEELTAALEARVDDLFDQEATLHSIDAVPALVPSSDSEFEADMDAFTEGTEHLPAYSGTYSRADIYLDHD
jgi:hypothetical protein